MFWDAFISPKKFAFEMEALTHGVFYSDFGFVTTDKLLFFRYFFVNSFEIFYPFLFFSLIVHYFDLKFSVSKLLFRYHSLKAQLAGILSCKSEIQL